MVKDMLSPHILLSTPPINLNNHIDKITTSEWGIQELFCGYVTTYNIELTEKSIFKIYIKLQGISY